MRKVEGSETGPIMHRHCHIVAALSILLGACGSVATDKKGSRSIRGLVRVDVSESPR